MHVHDISRRPQSATNFPERSVRYERRAQARRRDPLSHPHSTPERLLKIYISLYLYCRMRKNLFDGQFEEEVAGVDHQRGQDL
jgi:hypothetical protein